MPFPAGPLPSNGDLRSQPVPADCLPKPFGRAQLRSCSELIRINGTLQRLDLEDETLPNRQQQLLEPLQRRCLDPTLDPADRVLAGPRPHGKRLLAQPSSLPNRPEYACNVLTPHKVSII